MKYVGHSRRKKGLKRGGAYMLELLLYMAECPTSEAKCRGAVGRVVAATKSS